ncbi:hypothetical protein RFI_14212, partial [Reticulomyxa filosa]
MNWHVKRLVSQLSVSQKHIEFLESYRKEMNKRQGQKAKSGGAREQEKKEGHEECNYMYMHRQIMYLNEELVLLRDLYKQKEQYLSKEYHEKIAALQRELSLLSPLPVLQKPDSPSAAAVHFNTTQRPNQIEREEYYNMNASASANVNVNVNTNVNANASETYNDKNAEEIDSTHSNDDHLSHSAIDNERAAAHRDNERDGEKGKENDIDDDDIALLKQSFSSLRRTITKRTMRGSDLQKQIEMLKHHNEMLQ